MFTTTMFNTTSVLQNIQNLNKHIDQYIDQMNSYIDHMDPYIEQVIPYIMKIMLGMVLGLVLCFIFEFLLLIPKIAFWISKQLYNSIILILVNVYSETIRIHNQQKQQQQQIDEETIVKIKQQQQKVEEALVKIKQQQQTVREIREKVEKRKSIEQQNVEEAKLEQQVRETWIAKLDEQVNEVRKSVSEPVSIGDWLMTRPVEYINGFRVVRNYSDFSFVVIGKAIGNVNTRLKEKFTALGKWYPDLACGPGWLFFNNNYENVCDALNECRYIEIINGFTVVRNYSDKSFVVNEKTKSLKEKEKEKLSELGIWIHNLIYGPGWVFSNNNYENVCDVLNGK